MKEVFITFFALAGTVITKYLGGMDAVLGALIFIIVVDYATGVILALVYKKSKKTKDGAYASYTGFQGIVKKVMLLVSVAVAQQLDVALNLDGYIRTLIIMFFIANEGLSIIENTGLMGVPWPKAVKNMLEVLRDKTNNADIEEGAKGE